MLRQNAAGLLKTGKGRLEHVQNPFLSSEEQLRRGKILVKDQVSHQIEEPC
jgi:hypothetical protein